ncbi:MAG: transglycosylase SLT domain-containing protein [Candidatus Paceibacterota bacterium]|jgi:soluble lytic murein transglycosylase
MAAASSYVFQIPTGLTNIRNEQDRIDKEHANYQKNINKIANIIKKYADLNIIERFEIAKLIYDESIYYGIDPIKVTSLIKTESTFNKRALSNRGAVGLTQILPSTAKYMADMITLPYSEELLWDPAYNIHIGIAYLSYLNKRNSSLDNALQCYYAGSVTEVAESYRDSINKTYSANK